MRRRFIIQYRSGGRCEWCGAVNYIPHPDTGSKVVLTIAHVWDRPGHNFKRLRNRMIRTLRAGQLPLPLSVEASLAMEIYQGMVAAGQLTPPESGYQLSIPRSAYEYVA